MVINAFSLHVQPDFTEFQLPKELQKSLCCMKSFSSLIFILQYLHILQMNQFEVTLQINLHWNRCFLTTTTTKNAEAFSLTFREDQFVTEKRRISNHGSTLCWKNNPEGGDSV